MKDRTFNNLLREQLDTFVNAISLKKNINKKTLNELFTMNINNFMKDIGSQEIDDDKEIDTELWDWFLQTIDESMKETPKEWMVLLKKEKLKILCYKFFTKKELLDKGELKKTVKKQIRKFFTALQNYSDLEGFREKISNLPSELLSNLVRHLFSLSNNLSEKITISKQELSKEIKQLSKDRMDMIEKINLVSKSYQSILDITRLKELYDNGVFFEDSILNRAINEYVSKLVSHKTAIKNIKDAFSNTLTNDLQTQSQTSTAYVNHIESIKKDEGKEFFTSKGFQVGNRLSNEIESIKNKKTNDSIINKDSVFKEPTDYLSNVVSPWDKDESDYGPGDMDNDELGGGNSGGAIGGGSSGGGDPLSGGGFSSDESTFDSPIDLKGEDNPDVDLSGEEGDSDTPLPTGEDGMPVDFGSEETNPDATEDEKNK